MQISPQCSESSRKVYSLLVLKQLERAAEITENVNNPSPVDHDLPQLTHLSLQKSTPKTEAF